MLSPSIIALAMSVFSCSGGGQASNKTGEGTQESAVLAESAATVTSAVQAPTPPETIPSFTFYKANSGIKFTQNDLAKTGNIVLLFFDPGCSHCQDETRDIGKNYQQVKTANFYFIAMQDPSLMEDFMATYGGELKGKSNVTLLYDRNVEFLPKFNPKQYPAVYVYGSDHQLRAYWDGEKKIDKIIEAINSK